eukprot:GEMP01001127.1.p1 GENE.GEMP01001127.1~~GEMP01001127.1.p1  ORF type:complete len:1606 (+),score=407.21 GEMP01001127.1:159-4976(+)
MVRGNFFAQRLGSARKTRRPQHEAERRATIAPLPKDGRRRSLLANPCVTPTNVRPAPASPVAEPSLTILEPAQPPPVPSIDVSLLPHACDFAADEVDLDLAAHSVFSYQGNDAPLSPIRPLPPLLSQAVSLCSPQRRVPLRLFASPPHGAPRVVGNDGMWGSPIRGRRLTGSPLSPALQGAPTPSYSSGTRGCDVVRRGDASLSSRNQYEEVLGHAGSQNCGAVEEVLLSIRGARLQQRMVARLQTLHEGVIAIHSENEDGNNSSLPPRPSKEKREQTTGSVPKKRQRIGEKTAVGGDLPQNGVPQLLHMAPLPSPKSHHAVESLIPPRVPPSSPRMRLSIANSPFAVQRSSKGNNKTSIAMRHVLRVSPRRAAPARRPWRLKGDLLLTQTRMARDAAELCGDTDGMDRGESRDDDRTPHRCSAHTGTDDGHVGSSRRASEAVGSANNAAESVSAREDGCRRRVGSRVAKKVAETGGEAQADNNSKKGRRASALREDDGSTAMGDDGHGNRKLDGRPAGKAPGAEDAGEGKTAGSARNDAHNAKNMGRDGIRRPHADHRRSSQRNAVGVNVVRKVTGHSKTNARLRGKARAPARQMRNPKECAGKVEEITANEQQQSTTIRGNTGANTISSQAGGAKENDMPGARNRNQRRASVKGPCAQRNRIGNEGLTVVAAKCGELSKKRSREGASRSTSRDPIYVNADDSAIGEMCAQKTPAAASTTAVALVNDGDAHAPANERQRTPDAKRRRPNWALWDDVVVIVDTPVSAKLARVAPVSICGAPDGSEGYHPLPTGNGVCAASSSPLPICDTVNSNDGQLALPKSNPIPISNSPLPIRVAPNMCDMRISLSVRKNSQLPLQETLPEPISTMIHLVTDSPARVRTSGVKYRDAYVNGSASPKPTTHGGKLGASTSCNATVRPASSKSSLNKTDAASGNQRRHDATPPLNMLQHDAPDMDAANPTLAIHVLADRSLDVAEATPRNFMRTEGVLRPHPTTALVAIPDPSCATPRAQLSVKAKAKTVKGRRRSSYLPAFGAREIANDPISCFTQASPIISGTRSAQSFGREKQYRAQRPCADNPVPAAPPTHDITIPTNGTTRKSVTSKTRVLAPPPACERVFTKPGRRSSLISTIAESDLMVASAGANPINLAPSEASRAPPMGAARSASGMSAERPTMAPKRPPGAPTSLVWVPCADNIQGSDVYSPTHYGGNMDNPVASVRNAPSTASRDHSSEQQVRSKPLLDEEREGLIAGPDPAMRADEKRWNNEKRAAADADSGGRPPAQSAAPSMVPVEVATSGERHDLAPTSPPRGLSSAPSRSVTSCIPHQLLSPPPYTLPTATEGKLCAQRRASPLDVAPIPISTKFTAAPAPGQPTRPPLAKHAASSRIPETIQSFADTPYADARPAPESARPLPPLADNHVDPFSMILVPWHLQNPLAKASEPLCSPIESFGGSPIGPPVDHCNTQIIPFGCETPRFHASQLMRYRPEVAPLTRPVGVKPIGGGLQELLLQAQKEYLSDCVVATSRITQNMDDCKCELWEVTEIIKLPLSLILMLRGDDKLARCVVPRKHLNYGYCLNNVRQGDRVAVIVAHEVSASSTIILPLIIRKM